MYRFNMTDLTLVQKKAKIRLKKYGSYAVIYRDIYRTKSGTWVIKYQNQIRTLYLDKDYGTWFWFLNPIDWKGGDILWKNGW